jgi:NAD(P)-dependent dehydrogenase (short-subunit alcohol dehydrogenase family)
MSSELAGRAALVTGGSRRLGAEIVRALARQGVGVAVNYRDSGEAARALAQAVQGEGGQAEAFYGDVADEASLHQLVQTAHDRFGRLDILVHNAGPYVDAPLARLAAEQWDVIFDTNVKAAFLAAQHAFPLMQANGWGRIVNISAGSAFVRNHSVYGLAKNALQTLTEALALEFGPDVTVNAIAPGLMDDPEVEAEVRQAMREDTPLRRLATLPAVANMVCLLCSSAFDTVTGQVIVMDGGQTLPRGMVPGEAA